MDFVVNRSALGFSVVISNVSPVPELKLQSILGGAELETPADVELHFLERSLLQD